MESELIKDNKGGAIKVTFASMSTAELKRLALAFPEAFDEYVKRTLAKPIR